MEDQERQEYIDDGWIQAIVIFEVVGNPQRHVVQSLDSYLENVETSDDIRILSKDREPPEEIDDGMYSTLAEVELLADGLETITWLCFNFSPASIEIREPVHFQFHASKVQDWINDFLAKLHEVGKVSKQVKSNNKLLTKNMQRLIKNGIIICINNGMDTPKEIEENLGIEYERLKPFFEALVEEGKIELHEDRYKRPE